MALVTGEVMIVVSCDVWAIHAVSIPSRAFAGQVGDGHRPRSSCQPTR
jgi:hypothetical protein